MDWDHDGDLDIWLSNRTSPRLRFLRNEHCDRMAKDNGNWVAVRLHGTRCNRDAIGARVTVNVIGDNPTRMIRTLRAGEGYLSQRSKWLHFGLAPGNSIKSVDIRWPGGIQERIEGITKNQHFDVVEGSGKASLWSRPTSSVGIAKNQRPTLDEPVVRPIRIVAHRRLPIPMLEFTKRDSKVGTIEFGGTRPTLVVVWATWCKPCLSELAELAASDLNESKLSIVSLCVDSEDQGSSREAFEVLSKLGVDWEGGLATESTRTKLDCLQRILVSRQAPLSIPMSILLDRDGRLAVIYKGAVPMAMLRHDAELFHQAETDNPDLAVPMPGRWYVKAMPPDRMSMVSRLIAVELPNDALEYLDRHVLPVVQSGSIHDTNPAWTSPQVSEAYFRVGIQLAKRETRMRAEHAFATAIELTPQNLMARAAMANLMRVQGRSSDALRHYEEMRKQHPNNPVILNDMAWLLASSKDPQTRNPAEAISLAKRACELSENQLAPILDTLATAYASAKRFDDAVRTIDQAILLTETSGNRNYRAKLIAKRETFDAQRTAE